VVKTLPCFKHRREARGRLPENCLRYLRTFLRPRGPAAGAPPPYEAPGPPSATLRSFISSVDELFGTKSLDCGSPLFGWVGGSPVLRGDGGPAAGYPAPPAYGAPYPY